MYIYIYDIQVSNNMVPINRVILEGIPVCYMYVNSVHNEKECIYMEASIQRMQEAIKCNNKCKKKSKLPVVIHIINVIWVKLYIS